MKLMPWTKGSSSREESLAEINRKMQRALEEALMKNIHLQEVSRRTDWVLMPERHVYAHSFQTHPSPTN